MPFYEYICNSCEGEFERFQKISDAPVKECPDCGEDVRKKIFAPPVILKGAGFYETEYGRSKHNHPDAGKGESTGGSSKTEAKNDAGASKTEGAAKTEGSTKKSDSGSQSASSAKQSTKDGGKAA